MKHRVKTYELDTKKPVVTSIPVPSGVTIEAIQSIGNGIARLVTVESLEDDDPRKQSAMPMGRTLAIHIVEEEAEIDLLKFVYLGMVLDADGKILYALAGGERNG